MEIAITVNYFLIFCHYGCFYINLEGFFSEVRTELLLFLKNCTKKQDFKTIENFKTHFPVKNKIISPFLICVRQSLHRIQNFLASDVWIYKKKKKKKPFQRRLYKPNVFVCLIQSVKKKEGSCNNKLLCTSFCWLPCLICNLIHLRMLYTKITLNLSLQTCPICLTWCSLNNSIERYRAC